VGSEQAPVIQTESSQFVLFASYSESQHDRQAFLAMNGSTFTTKQAQVALQTVRQELALACEQADRSVDSVSLLAVSKTFPASHVLAMAENGQCAFGENYLQEALQKQETIRHERPELNLEWHFIGAIQSNKSRPVAEHFDWVHTVDRLKIAQRLNDQRSENLAPLNICIQVNIDGSETKAGCTPEQCGELTRAIMKMPRLALRGLMAIPRPSATHEEQIAPFAALRALRDKLRTELGEASTADPSLLDTLSMGMTADMTAAVNQGSTMVRIGTALFGQRARKPGAQ
jgi:pyridoxal phosphate enzyme (YggS family)